jgi:hypothetical protein
VSAEEEAEDEVLADMEQLVGALRAGGEALHERLVADNAVLEATRDAVDANMGSISGANKKLEAENRASLLSLCGVFAMLAWVATIFAGSYVAMKVLRKPPRHAFASSPGATAVPASATVSASLLPQRQEAALEQEPASTPVLQYLAPEAGATVAPEAVAPAVSETQSFSIDGYLLSEPTRGPQPSLEGDLRDAALAFQNLREDVAEVQLHVLDDAGPPDGVATEEADSALAAGHAEPSSPTPEPTQSAEVRAYYAQQAAYAKMRQQKEEAQVQAGAE